MPLGIAYRKELSQYDFGPGHPFRGARFAEFMDFLKAKHVLDGKAETIPFNKASEADLLAVHSRDYIGKVKACEKQSIPLDPDTPTHPGTFEAALWICGSSIAAAAHALKTGKAIGFGGLHHAGRGRGAGFCVLNDVAVAAAKILAEKKTGRITVFDYDAHHGDGTQEIFWESNKVLYISIHQDPRTQYPGTGFVHETGAREGKGYKINIPVPPGAGDRCYAEAVNEIVLPAINQFNPGLVVGNGGSDAHHSDSLTQLGLTFKGFEMIGKSFLEMKKPFCLLLASGYNPVVLPKAWYSLIAPLMGGKAVEGDSFNEPAWVVEKTAGVIKELKDALSPYWSL